MTNGIHPLAVAGDTVTLMTLVDGRVRRHHFSDQWFAESVRQLIGAQKKAPPAYHWLGADAEAL